MMLPMLARTYFPAVSMSANASTALRMTARQESNLTWRTEQSVASDRRWRWQPKLLSQPMLVRERWLCPPSSELPMMWMRSSCC